MFAVLRRLPFTLTFLIIMIVANTAAGTLTGELPAEMLTRWGISFDRIAEGELWRLITATFLSHDLGMFLRQCVFAASVIGYSEWIRGSVSTTIQFFGLDIAVGIILLIVIQILPQLSHLNSVYDVGMSLGGFGLIGVIISGFRFNFVWFIAIMIAILVKYTLAPDPIADLGHVVALMLGYVTGKVVYSRTSDNQSSLPPS